MTKKEFLNSITNGKVDVLQLLLDLLGELKIDYCIIGGLAVNAYVEPVVSLDLDIVLVTDRLDSFLEKAKAIFTIEQFPHSINLSHPDSDLRIQIQTDSAYQDFIPRSSLKNVMGYDMKVAEIKDVLQGEIKTFTNDQRQPSKRKKDLADIFRLTEKYPELQTLLPESIRNIEILTDEANKIINSRITFIKRYYPTVRDAYKNRYDWPELDPLRHEICLCIIFGFCQAAITLTNHFLESLLKNALIINDSDKEKIDQVQQEGIITSVKKKYKPGLESYGDKNLNKTIDHACTLGLITKEQKKKLHEFREKFRNAYSHSDKKKTFGDSRIPVTGIKLENNEFKIDEIGDPKISDLIIGQGIIQVIMAANDAPEYFLYIDSLAREIRKKVFNTTTNP